MKENDGTDLRIWRADDAVTQPSIWKCEKSPGKRTFQDSLQEE